MTQDELKNEISNQIQGMSDDQRYCVFYFTKYLNSIPKKENDWFKFLYKETPNDPSYSEVVLFYISILLAFLFTLICAISFLAKINLFGFETSVLVFLIFTFFWIFLRASRKDMNATSHLIAAGMGALGGALAAILTK